MTANLLGVRMTSRLTSSWRGKGRIRFGDLEREIPALVDFSEKLESKTMLSE